MKRTLGTYGIVTCFVLTAFVPAAVGQDAQADLLSVVPGDAWAALCVRNASELDQKLMTLTQRLNVPQVSALQLVKMQLGLMSGVNDSGGVAAVLMPVDNFGAISQGIVVLIPCQDYAGMTSMMQLEDAGEGFEGISKGIIVGQPAFVASYGAYALLAPAPGSIQKFLAAKDKPKIAKAWTKHQTQRFATDDVTLWLNIDGIVASPAFQTGVVPMMAMMSGGAFNPQELQEIRSWVVSFRLDGDGVYLGLSQTVKEGSESAKLLASSKPTTDSLLAGLPAEDYLIAMGIHGSKEAWGKIANSIDKMLSNPMIAMQLQSDPEKLNRVKKIVTGMLSATRDMSFSVAALPAGPDGMIGFTKVAKVEGGAAKQCSQLGDLIGTIVSMAPGPDGEKIQKMIKFTPDAEKIAGVNVSHLLINLDKADDVNAEQLAQLKKVVGKEALLFRIAAVGDKHIAATFGGGAARMEQVIGLIKSGDAPLGANEGIKKIAGLLPASRVLEAYVAIDQLMKTAGDISKATDSPDGPPSFPKIDAPAAIVAGPVGTDTFQIDVAAPMQLVVAIKDVLMTAQGGDQPASPTEHKVDEQPAESAPAGS